VLFLHRPFFSSKTKKELTTDEKAKAFLIIAKQRNGPTGVIPLAFREEFTLFTAFVPEIEQ
ncbi:MAG: DnaB-like helicase C-terminal domain-containing protein, partial [Acidobacteria bacterium]|nr:DnaB-like helicase C-terminal domain-containing protein [Acidobacteriota bacterium]